MGKRGPRPTPTETKKRKGNPGRRPLNEQEPTPPSGEPTCPIWIKGEAKAEWTRIVPELLKLGVLTLVDRAALAACCQAWAELVECTQVLHQQGRIVVEPIIDKSGAHIGDKHKAHPIVRMQRDAFARLRAYLAEFGLTPASRVNVKTEKPKTIDPFQRLMNRAGKDS
jgi:P27 family predicted phage terminase small subunit